MKTLSDVLGAYYQQLQELHLPEFIVEDRARFFHSWKTLSSQRHSSASAAATASPQTTGISTQAGGFTPTETGAVTPAAGSKSESFSPIKPRELLSVAHFQHLFEKEQDALGAAPQTAQPTAAPELGREQKRQLLLPLFKTVQQCENCPLCQSRTKAVFGAGAADARVMVIGEAPGADEDAQGLPFVGRAGELLTRMLAAINLDRQKDCFITNILKCRPPSNRAPQDSEILSCTAYLHPQIEIINPQALLLLGKTAAATVLQSVEPISRLRMSTHQYKHIPAFVTYHPAALLRNEQYKAPAWQDLQKLQAYLQSTN